MLQNQFDAEKVTFRPLLIQTLKYWKVFEISWSKVHQNAISDLQTKFQLIVRSTFWNFHEKSLESVLGRKSLFYSTFDSNFKILKSFRNFFVKIHDLQVFSWWMEKIKKSWSLSNFDPNRIPKPLQKTWKLTKFWSFSSFTVKLWKSVKMIKLEYKLDLQWFLWLMEHYYEVLVIFKFWPESHKRTLGEMLKID